MEGKLSDEELNAFLLHLKGCSDCRKELEFDFMVNEGLKLLSGNGSGYDLTGLFQEELKEADSYIRHKKRTLRFSYIVLTLAIWAVLFSAVSFLHSLL